MAKLSDTQLILLSNAAKRDDGGVTFPSKTKGSAADKVVAPLIERGLLKSIGKTGGLQLWKTHESDGPLSLVITPKGQAAIGIESKQSVEDAHSRGGEGSKGKTRLKGSQLKKKSNRSRPSNGIDRVSRSRPNTKIAKVIQMLRKPAGASLDAMMSATGWQAHSVRGAMSGALKRKLGLDVISEKKNGRRVYRIAG